MENNLPEGWKVENLTEYIDFLPTGVKPFTGKKKYYSTGSIQDEKNVPEGEFTFENKPSRANRLSAKGDVFQARMKATDKGLFVENGLADSLFSSGFIQVRPKDKNYNNKLLYYFIKSHLFLNQRDEFATGSTQEALTDDKAKQILIPVPPIQEQPFIVEKLDALMAKMENNKARLEKIPKILKRFRQSVLAAAVSGKLTKEWRDTNPNIENGKKLLDSIIKERQKNNSKVKVNLSPSDNEEPIPDSWVWTCLLNIADVIGGVTKGRKFKDKKTIMLPYLRVANVQDGYLDLAIIKEIEVLPDDIEKYRLFAGDILFTEGGDRDKLGRGTIWKNEINDCIHQNHIFRARVNHKFVVPEFVSIFTKSEIARNYFFENASQTVNLASINLKMLGGVPIALPPTEEQREIVRRIEDLFAFADKIEERFNKVKTQIDKLPQSVLGKAFRGELVAKENSVAMAAEPKTNYTRKS